MQKLQDFKTILGAIQLLFKIVIKLKILENLETMLYYLTLISLYMAIYTFPIT